jgi:hypothetical protein
LYVQYVSIVVLCLKEAIPLQEFTIVGRIMSQLDGWRVLKSVYEDALTFMSSIRILSRLFRHHN